MTRFLKDYFLQYTNQKFRLPLKEFFMRSGQNLGSVQGSGNRFFFFAGNRLTRKSAASSSTASRSTFLWKNIGRGFESSLAYNVSVSTFASKRGFSVEEWGFRKKKFARIFFFGNRNWILLSRYFKIRKFENNIKTLFHRSKSKMLQQRAQRSKK